MKLKTNFEQKLLILAIIFLPINHFRIDIPFIGTVLSKIFILAGMLLYFIKLVNSKQKLNSFERFSFFYLFVFFLLQCLCTVIGIQEFDYYALVSNTSKQRIAGYRCYGNKDMVVSAVFKGLSAICYFFVWGVFVGISNV